jgi:hypothetical protein
MLFSILLILQMLKDWKVDPNGYPRLLQTFQVCYGVESVDMVESVDELEEDVELFEDDDDTNFFEHSQRTRSVSDITSTRSLSTSSRIATVSSFQKAEGMTCSLEKLTNITLQQPQQKEFEKIENKFSELFMHACLTVHTIEMVVRHAKEYGVPKELPSLNDFSDTSFNKYTHNATTEMHKSLLTIVNNSAYGSSGGGLVCYYLLTKYVKPISKVRALTSMLEYSAKQDCITKEAIDAHFAIGE